MGELVFRCPRTADHIYAGVGTDQQNLSKIWSLSMRVYCAHCREYHELPVREAIIEEHA
jgi:hypothetical protein